MLQPEGSLQAEQAARKRSVTSPASAPALLHSLSVYRCHVSPHTTPCRLRVRVPWPTWQPARRSAVAP